MNRVVITGVSVISALGDTVPVFWDNMQKGNHGIRPISGFDPERIHVKLACEVPDFDPTVHGIERRDARKMDRYCQLALAAANDAIADAGTKFKDLDPYRVGVMVSSGIGGIQTTLDEEKKRLEKGPGRISPFLIPMMIPNMAAGNIAIAHGLKGANMAIVTACATSANAIGEGFRRIKHGYEDVMVVGGSEASIVELAAGGFDNMRALSRSTDPDRASIPFDKERSGFVMGEGAAILVLEELEHAKNRGAKIYAEVCGYGATDDAYHITSPDPEGSGAARAMQDAICEAGITPEQVDYINAHGTSTEINDRVETQAIKIALGSHAYEVAVSSTKSMHGHMLGAAGSVEAIICALALRDGIIPPTIGYKEPDEECDLDYVTSGKREQLIEVALSNSLGFGGHNAVLCLKKYKG